MRFSEIYAVFYTYFSFSIFIEFSYSHIFFSEVIGVGELINKINGNSFSSYYQIVPHLCMSTVAGCHIKFSY